MPKYDVIVVGAGAAGGPLAAKLSEDSDRKVLLIEAGPDFDKTEDFPADLLDAAQMTGANPGHPLNWAFVANLTPDLAYTVARGRLLGGSTSFNGTYFIRGKKADFDRYEALGNTEWSFDKVLPHFKELENDLQYGDSEYHSSKGPVTILRVLGDDRDPLTKAFEEASKDLGFDYEADKNGEQKAGYGPLPMNNKDGIRLNTGITFVNPARHRDNLTVRGDTYARRVIFDGTTVTGLEVETNGKVEVIEAKEIVLSAGAIKSPHLLALSGVGPKAELEKAGIPVVVDLPGVGKNFTDHPDITVTAIPTKAGKKLAKSKQAFQTVLNFPSKDSKYESDLEILLMSRSLAQMMNMDRSNPLKGMFDMVRHPIKTYKSLKGVDLKRLSMQMKVMQDYGMPVAVQQAESLGEITTTSSDPNVQPRIDYNYLTDESDLRRMREVVRISHGMFTSKHFKPYIQEVRGLDDATLNDDEALNAWMKKNLGTAIHAASSAQMGSDPAKGAVVDQYGRVYGVTGLRVADTSILPFVPSRGPAATATMIGMHVANFMRTNAGA